MTGPVRKGKETPSRGHVPGPLIMVIGFDLFKRMFKKKVKKKKTDDDEEETENDVARRGGGLTKKDLQDWANLQRTLKETEGKAKPQAVEGAPEREEEPEKEPPGPGGYGEARQGYNYLFEELRPLNAYMCFFKMMEKGMQGFCISSTYPRKIRDHHKKDFADLETLPIYWLSDWYGASQEFLNIGQEERTLRPTRLDFEIMKEISNFIKKNRGKGVLLLDGIETLVMANSFEKVISFLTNINNMASANQCSVLAPINPGVFKRRDRFILQKIFDEVRVFMPEEIEDDEEE
jgi:hypothetical protein